MRLKWQKILTLMLVICFTFGQSFAFDPGSDKTEKKAAKKAVKAKQPATSEELKALKEQLEAEHQKVEALQKELQTTLQQLQQKIDSLQNTANQAQTTADTASSSSKQTATSLSTVQSNVTELKTAQVAAVEAEKKTAKRVDDLESPAAIHYKGVTLTPGGFLAITTINRNHNANGDTADSWGTIPLDGSANGKMNEFRMSGRSSRISLKAESQFGKVKAMGYFEMDFLGTTPNANETQTSSYAPRMRLAFFNLTIPHGWQFAAGQNWTLLQTTKKGIDPFSEWLPSILDNSYTTGFSYARLGSIRVTKELTKKSWAAIAIENPEMGVNSQCLQGVGTASPASCTIATLGNIQGYQNSTASGSPTNSGFAATQTPSIDMAPDIAAKIAVEPGWGHYEVKGVTRFFRDRVYPNYGAASSLTGATNKTSVGAGIGVGAVLPVVAKKLDVEIQGLFGKGIGRYGTTSGPDVTYNTTGKPVPVKSAQAIIGIEAHPTPKLDVNIYGGFEYYGRTVFTSSTALFGATTTATNAPIVTGYGATQFWDSGCGREFPGTTAATACMSSGQNRSVFTIHPGFWYRVWKGKQGTVQFGSFYAYTQRNTWAGAGGYGQGNEHMVMTGVRYNLP